MVVHPARGNYEGTLINALLARYRDLPRTGDKTRPGVVHRLDKDTTGLLVVAKTDVALRSLGRQMELKTARRIYLAVVWGSVPLDKGMVDAPIGRHPIDRKRMAVTPFRSRHAVTEYRVIRRYGRLATLLEVSLRTGRTHQIRVHMSHLGHPVFGDPKYGGRTKRLGGLPPRERRRAEELLDIVPRQALHSEVLGFVHPVTGGYMEFRAEPPEDMRKLFEELGWGT